MLYRNPGHDPQQVTVPMKKTSPLTETNLEQDQGHMPIQTIFIFSNFLSDSIKDKPAVWDET